MLLKTVIGAVTLAAVCPLAAPATGPPHARVAVVDTGPLVVRGTHFASAKRVRVVVTTNDGSGARTVTTTLAGTFRLRFASIALQRCAMYAVRATDTTGTRAVLRVVPECANGPIP